jgi:hypothetical protein
MAVGWVWTQLDFLPGHDPAYVRPAPAGGNPTENRSRGSKESRQNKLSVGSLWDSRPRLSRTKGQPGAAVPHPEPGRGPYRTGYSGETPKRRSVNLVRQSGQKDKGQNRGKTPDRHTDRVPGTFWLCPFVLCPRSYAVAFSGQVGPTLVGPEHQTIKRVLARLMRLADLFRIPRRPADFS